VTTESRAFVATSRLRIDPFIQPFAMGALLVALVFPFELLGAKFLWWTWHDTDPLLITRVYGVPVHALFYHFFFGFAFNAAHHTLRRLSASAVSCRRYDLNLTMRFCGLNAIVSG
jgi:hypothetical protein